MTSQATFVSAASPSSAVVVAMGDWVGGRAQLFDAPGNVRNVPGAARPDATDTSSGATDPFGIGPMAHAELAGGSKTKPLNCGLGRMEFSSPEDADHACERENPPAPAVYSVGLGVFFTAQREANEPPSREQPDCTGDTEGADCSRSRNLASSFGSVPASPTRQFTLPPLA